MLKLLSVNFIRIVLIKEGEQGNAVWTRDFDRRR
jgi:hypothetical protein